MTRVKTIRGRRGFFCGLLLATTFMFEPAAAAPRSSSAAKSELVAEGVDCGLVASAFSRASALRHLQKTKAVPCKLQSRDEVAAYLKQTIEKKIPPDRLRYEGRVYELLGLIPPGYDYVHNVLALYTDQLGGYYDAEQKYYAMASWLPSAMQMPIAVHELTHALQDQHYDLLKLVDDDHASSDALMARSSLVEGDATAVMLDYTRSLSGERSIRYEASVSGFMMQSVAGAMLSSGMSAAPSALRGIMIFPYVSGLNFVHRLLRERGYRSVDEAYERLPQSTAEILHPERYVERSFAPETLPAPPPPPGVDLVRNEPAFQDSLGEFLLSTMLSGALPPSTAAQAASGWQGDRVAVYERTAGKVALVWNVRWLDEGAAAQGASAIDQMMRKRCSASGEDGEEQSGSGRRCRTTESGLTMSWARAGRDVSVTVLE